MSDMKKLMAIMDQAEKANQPKKMLKEDCNHSMPCACNSYLCESCYPPKKYDTVKGNDMPTVGKGPANPADPMINDNGQLSPMSRVQEIAEEEELNYSDKADALRAWNDKYKGYIGCNADDLPGGLIQAMTNTGIPSDGWEQNEWHNAIATLGSDEEWGEEEYNAAVDMSPITAGMEADLRAILGVDELGEDELRAVHVALNTTDEGTDIAEMQRMAGIQEDDEEFDDAEAGDSSADFEVAPDAMGAAPEADIMAEPDREEEIANNELSKIAPAVQGDAPMNVDDLMAEIMNMQNLGMSNAKIDYSDDMLIQMSPERIQRTYAKVMGEGSYNTANDYPELVDYIKQKGITSIEYFFDYPEAFEFAQNQLNDGNMPGDKEGSIEYMEMMLNRISDDIGIHEGVFDDMGMEDPDTDFGADEADFRRDAYRDTDRMDLEAKIRELATQTSNMEIIAKTLGVNIEDVRSVLAEATLAEAELQRLKNLVNY